jgi:hypothetical protein
MSCRCMHACLLRLNTMYSRPLPTSCSCHDAVLIIIARQLNFVITSLGVRAVFSHHFEIGCFVVIIVRNLVPISIDHNSSSAFARWNAVAGRSEIKYLDCVSLCWTVSGTQTNLPQDMFGCHAALRQHTAVH